MPSVLVALACLLVSVGAAAALADEQHDAAVEQLDRRKSLVVEAVAGETGRYVDTLRTVAAATGAYTPLTSVTFSQATAPLTRMRLAGATSIAFLVPSSSSAVPATQALWRSRGQPGLTLEPVGGVDEHIFAVFSVPLDGVTKPRFGMDIATAPAPTQAMREARRTGQVAISQAYQLLIDQQLPQAQRQTSFSLTAPVFGAPTAAGRRPFVGWVLMGLRGQDFVGATLHRVAQDLVDVSLHAQNVAGVEVPVARQVAAVSGRRDVSAGAEVPVADRTWRLRVSVPARQLPGGVTGLPGVVGGSGVLVSVVLAGLVWVLATGRARARAQVEVAVADVAAAEAEARRKAALLAAILDSISDGVAVVDADGAFLLRNPAAEALLGLGDDGRGPGHWQEHYGIFRVNGRTPFPTDELPLVRALAGEPTEQVELVIRNAGHPDGVVLSVSGRPMHALDRPGAVAVFHDITHRKAAEADLAAARDALTEQKAYLQQILDAIEVTVVACDTSGMIVLANRTARRTLVRGDTLPDITDALGAAGVRTVDGGDVPGADFPLLRALTGEHVDGTELVVPQADGFDRRMIAHARPLYDAAGRPIGAVASSYDVTALREQEADLQAFAGVAAHDLRAPLAALSGYTEILAADLADGATPESLRPTLARMGNGIDRMVRLIDDLLAYATARDRPLRRETVDLAALVDAVVAERTAHLRAAPGAGGAAPLFPEVDVGPLPAVRADAGMIRQLLDNLIGNSLKYTVPGRPAQLTIYAEPAGGGSTSIQVTDRGIGIPVADQSHVFASFHRAAAHTAYTGTGLGLAICHRIVDRHGGTITATDNPGGGTRVVFTLPIDPVPADPVAADPVPADPVPAVASPLVERPPEPPVAAHPAAPARR